VQIGTGEKNSLSSEFEEESKKRDLHRVTEHPERLSKRLLEQKNSQEGITFSSRRRKEKELFP
jgi:hypothetical protein